MKHILIYIMAAMSFASCSYLDTEPVDNLPADDAKGSKEEMFGMLVGVYDGLGSRYLYGESLWNVFDCGTDIQVMNRSYIVANDVRIYDFNFSEFTVGETWRALYDGIGRANTFIQKVELMDSTVLGGIRNKEAYLGEAKAIRAIYYMNLLTIWGDVPLKLKSTKNLEDIQVPRSPQAEVYAVVTQDLEYAAQKCFTAQELNNPGRVSQTAAMGLLARAYMYMSGYPVNQNNWDKVKYWTEQIVISHAGVHQLNPDYTQVFKNVCGDIYDNQYREPMFEVEFYGNNLTGGYTEGGYLGSTIGIQQTATTQFALDSLGYAYGFHDATNVLNNMYGGRGTSDVRRDWNIATYTFTDGKKVYHTKTDGNAAKWRREYEKVFPKNKNATPTNFAVIRYSDVLLMLAEASYNLNDMPNAYKYLNEVRQRAHATVIPESSLSNEELMQTIRDERARELCYECVRRADLRRWGKNVYFDAIKSPLNVYPATDLHVKAALNVSERHLYYPIPEIEMSVNKKITQNLGW